MEFQKAFWNALRTRPVEALAAIYWHVTGRKLRARNRLRISPEQGPEAYPRWIARIERRSDILAGAEQAMAGWLQKPLFSIVIFGREHGSEADIERLVAMLRQQVYPHWELLIAGGTIPAPAAGSSGKIHVLDGQPSNALAALRMGAESAQGAFVIPLASGICLAPTALFHYAEAVEAHPDAVMLFGDEDRIDEGQQRHDPWFKPQWNDELALAQDYVSRALALSMDATRNALRNDRDGNVATPYALALAVAWSAPGQVFHVAHIQSHIDDSAIAGTDEERIRAVRGHLSDRGATGVSVSAGLHGTVRVDWPLSDPPPSVTIIIPTRDKLELLGPCLSSLFERTRYSNFDILIIDNGSRLPATLTYLDDLVRRGAIRVMRDELPYNFPRMNNMAVRHAAGDYVCLLNNDTEVINGDWLDAMMRQASRPHVGAVGARLLYDDRSIQHAGVEIGLGDAAGHPHRFQPWEDPGYFARTHVPHEVSAVTAACMVVAKDKYLAVDGMDEEELGVAFNDVDFCLKLCAAGWTNIYTPCATLFHHESKTRGRDSSPEHVQRYRQELATLRSRWNTVGFLDPLHHMHLDRSTERYLIKM